MPTDNEYNYHTGNDFIHSTSIKITNKQGKSLEVHAIYRPHSKINDNVIGFIEQIQQQSQATSHKIIAGDFNLHHVEWGDKKNRQSGKITKKIFNNRAMAND